MSDYTLKDFRAAQNEMFPKTHQRGYGQQVAPPQLQRTTACSFPTSVEADQVSSFRPFLSNQATTTSLEPPRTREGVPVKDHFGQSLWIPNKIAQMAISAGVPYEALWQFDIRRCMYIAHWDGNRLEFES